MNGSSGDPREQTSVIGMDSGNSEHGAVATKPGCCIECGEPAFTLVCVKCYRPDPVRYRNVRPNSPDCFDAGDSSTHADYDSASNLGEYGGARGFQRDHDPRRAAGCDRRHNGRPYRRDESESPYWDD